MRLLAAAALTMLLFFPNPAEAQQIRRLCYYADNAPLSTLSKFDLLVFNSEC